MPAPASSPRDPRRGVGRRGEDLAVVHLRARGFDVLARNYRTRRGEIDVIAFDGQTLVFVEVKTRRLRGAGTAPGPGAGSPLDGVRGKQQARLRRLAAAWLAETSDRPRATELRFDAVGVLLDRASELVRLDHVEGTQ